MKTAAEHAKAQGLENEDGVVEDNLMVQKDTLQACFTLCLEGVAEFKKHGLAQASEGCDACAANIVELAKQHNIVLVLPK